MGVIAEMQVQMLLLCFAIGFLAELVDGALGMAYGVCCSSFLRIGLGLPAATTSMMVHLSEILTSGASAVSHLRFKNVDRPLFLKLLVPGILGGIVGALMLSNVGSKLEGIISVYLVFMGVMLLIRAFTNAKPRKRSVAFVTAIAAAGGFADATGGGGWGPIMTSSMISADENAGKMIGTVNAAEFFITLTESVIFTISLTGITQHWGELLTMMTGGVIAAPIAAKLCGKINRKVLLILVGVLLIGLNVYKLIALY